MKHRVTILIIYHTQTGNTRKLAVALRNGASSVAGVRAVLKKAGDATLRDLLGADGLAFGTPDFFSYMAGMLKDFFDRTCYLSEGKVTGKPYVAFVSHGGGGSALRSVEKLGRRFAFRKAAPPLLAEEPHGKKDLAKAFNLGRALAARVLRDAHGKK
jgi:flavorubredoxin